MSFVEGVLVSDIAGIAVLLDPEPSVHVPVAFLHVLLFDVLLAVTGPFARLFGLLLALVVSFGGGSVNFCGALGDGVVGGFC